MGLKGGGKGGRSYGIFFSVSCKFKNVGDHFEWAFSGVYGPNSNRKHCKMWEELTGLISLWDFPRFFGGDFNRIRFPSERLGGVSYTGLCMVFLISSLFMG